jgi:hypothetical protein
MEIHEQGLVSVLLDLHRRIDALVLEAYGWPADLDEAAMLERLVALNAERAEEERRGLVRWLRPEFRRRGRRWAGRRCRRKWGSCRRPWWRRQRGGLGSCQIGSRR